MLHHLARGYAYKRIAQRLGISDRTVESHVGAVLRKLQLTSRHEVCTGRRPAGSSTPDDLTTYGPARERTGPQSRGVIEGR